jgi:2-methylfumaryl-CoA hydratase
MTKTKSNYGNFFEDFQIGMRIQHPVPRTIHGGDLSMYIALTGDRRPLSSSSEFAHSMGLPREMVHDLLGFHIVFGKTVGEVSLNAVANLGYAKVLFHRPIHPGDTVHAESEVIGLRELSNGKAGIVWVTSRGLNQKGQEVVSFHRWVMVNKRDTMTKSGIDQPPTLPELVQPSEIPVPGNLNMQRFRDLQWATGGQYLWEDYEVGERIHHVDGMTIEESDHMQATRLYQNLAKVHFDQHQMAQSRFGRRLMYGGHVISVAYALSFNGLENLVRMAAWNSGAHANPTFAGDTLYAWTDVLDKAELPGKKGLAALRLRLVAVKNVDPSKVDVPLEVVGEDGKKGFDPRVVLSLDYWGLMPTR